MSQQFSELPPLVKAVSEEDCPTQQEQPQSPMAQWEARHYKRLQGSFDEAVKAAAGAGHPKSAWARGVGRPATAASALC